MAEAGAAHAVLPTARTPALASLRWVAACLVLALILIAAGPYVLDYYTVNILVRAFLYAAAALTVDVLWGFTGILTFGQGAFFGIGAYAAALVFTHIGFGTGTAVLALLAGVLVAMAIAALVGWLSFFYGAPPLYVGVVTLALPIVVVQLLYSGGTFTGSSSGLVGFDTFFLSVEQWFWITGAGLVVLTAALFLFTRSDTGRLLVGIRENEARCRYLGLNTTRLKIALMMAMAAVAAVAGYGYATYNVVVAPEIAGFVFGTELVVAVALGGRGTLVGPAIGAVGIELVSAYLSGNLPFVWRLILGAIFVAVIVLLPQGLIPPIWRAGGRALTALRRRAAQPVEALAPAPERRASAPGDTGADAIALTGVERRFGSLAVLTGIDLTIGKGELVSIVGPNGAGKTTLMRCIADGHERSTGSVLVNGHDIGRYGPQRVTGFGLGRSFQTTSLFETLTVRDSLRLARHRAQPLSLWTRAPALGLPEAALRIAHATGLDRALATEVRHLSHGMKRALELVMVLGLEPSVLLLDEPTAGLTNPERATIGAILVELRRTLGLAIVIIEHDLDFVREISSRVVVLHQGKILMDGTVDEVVASDLVRSIYAGEAASGLQP